MGALASLFGIGPATKAAGVPSISEDGTFMVAPWFSWLGFGTQTRAGTTVSAESALAIPTLYACVRVLAESTASLPLIVYRRLPNGGKERATDHPLYPIFHDSPNPAMTSFAWLETLVSHMATWGNSYNETLTDSFGRTEIWPIPPSRVEVGWENGQKVYDYLPDSGIKRRLPSNTVFHVPGLSTNGLVGLSPIQQFRESIGEAQATREFAQSFYRNSARPGLIMEHPATLSAGAIERLGTQMDQLRGSGNAGKTIIAEEGLKAHEIGVPPEDAQYIETRKLQREDICAVYRMQPHMVGILDRATFSNIEHQSIDFVVHTLRPWLVRIERAIKLYFLADEPDIFVEFLIDGLLRGDAVTRATALDIQRKAGVLRKNEWRAIENRNPDPEDDVWVPASNNTSVVVDEDGNRVETEEPMEGAPQSLEAEMPALTVVKSAGIIRCQSCNRLLAELAAAPYRFTCRNCKAITEAA